MHLTNTRFILLPNDNTVTALGIRYTDLLIYLSLRSFNNTEKEMCFPSYEAIAERASVEKQCVIKSIKRLEKARLINVKRSIKCRVSNYYYFSDVKRYNRVPYGIFEADDLTFNQKSMLVYLRHLFDSQHLKCFHIAYNELALLLGISYKTLYTQLKPLIEGGYIQKDYYIYRSGKKGRLVSLSYTDKINWKYIESAPAETTTLLNLKFS